MVVTDDKEFQCRDLSVYKETHGMYSFLAHVLLSISYRPTEIIRFLIYDNRKNTFPLIALSHNTVTLQNDCLMH
jgi:hypothetical protein